MYNVCFVSNSLSLLFFRNNSNHQMVLSKNKFPLFPMSSWEEDHDFMLLFFFDFWMVVVVFQQQGGSPPHNN